MMSDITLPVLEIFENPDSVQTMDERSLCAQMFMAWAHASMGQMPKNFGIVMAQAGERLGCVPSDRGLTEFAKAKGWLK